MDKVSDAKFSLGRGYGSKFFNAAHRLEVAKTSAYPIVSTLIKRYSPKSVIDIGCGDGMYLEKFKEAGIEVMGFDNSREGLKRCKCKKIRVKKVNLVKDNVEFKKRYDLAFCFEVAEHLPQYSSERLIQILIAASDLIAFTAAPPGQGGDNHVNEQPGSFWVSIFNKFHYDLEANDTELLKSAWHRAGVIRYMSDNLMVFRKNEC